MTISSLMKGWSYPPVLTIFLSALLRVVIDVVMRIDRTVGEEKSSSSSSDDKDNKSKGQNVRLQTICMLFYMLLFFLPPKHSYLVAFWSPLRILTVELVCILPSSVGIPSFIRHGGPLGRGCSKLVEVLCGLLLLRLQHHQQQTYTEMNDNDDENFLILGPLPTFRVLLLVLVLSILTNIVLWIWSRTFKTHGNHAGVNDMIQSSKGRTLLVKEHLMLVVLAIVNAVCEEVTSRGLWRMEFYRHIVILPVIDDDSSMHRQGQRRRLLYSNLYQAIVFGIWHYNGIPNGLVGVALTFVYGLAMGFLADYHQQGLLLPIMTHAIADYFIFATIARGNSSTSSRSSKNK